MADWRPTSLTVLSVGGLSRAELRAALAAAHVELNEAAQTLLSDGLFDNQAPERFEVVTCTARDLGLDRGAAMPLIVRTARGHGLRPCPAITGPYLRLGWTDPASAPDSILSNGSAPSASVTIASPPVRADDEYPKGFYLRAIDGVPWLRGYWSVDTHIWSASDAFAFRI